MESHALWAQRDFIHHYGVHHRIVAGTPIGRDTERLGSAIPALAGVTGYNDDIADMFRQHGWSDIPVPLVSLLDLADCLINPDDDLAAFVARRHLRRLQLDLDRPASDVGARGRASQRTLSGCS